MQPCRALRRSFAVLPSLAPPAPTPTTEEVSALADHIRQASRLLVVTGAGISTHSGIPDYRSPNGSYSKGHKPIQHAEFVRDSAARRRYWARSFLGWHYFSQAEPNIAHHTLSDLQAKGLLEGGLITQNVDGLHTAAGHRHVLALHGEIGLVECLSCGESTSRRSLQKRMADANPTWLSTVVAIKPEVQLRADGDAELSAAQQASFQVPSCVACGGVLKPAVTFFGGTVPAAIVQAAADAVLQADAMLVVGSSLQVFSAFRLVRSAAELLKPIAILTNGPTRADDLATLRIRCDATVLLPMVARHLSNS